MKKENTRLIFRFINPHTLLLAMFIILIVCIVTKIRNAIHFIHQDEVAEMEGNDGREILDVFFPVMSEDGEIIDTSDADTILVFGNSPFSDDRGSKDNLANLIAEKTGATVYNCSISGSSLAAEELYDLDNYPMDTYTFYWLAMYATLGSNEANFTSAAEALGDQVPPEAEEVCRILSTIDMDEVDVIAIMYDATDYFMGRSMSNDENSDDLSCFTGNLEAGIKLFQSFYPQIRVIVLSPTYAYAVTEDGEYVSSDMYTYGQDVLSTYSILECASAFECGVTYVDNLYGSVTEDNADEYLTDHLHLNVAGRNLVADRFVNALNYYHWD
ncbi:MAG: SGNH/GDSL hydrolase family protein [Candidatus Gastranaerophilales bacterium]|nr:SGNH/GDSL hydrolase family protein [Candidatus Gastranaerophilales bacterium]